MIDPTRVIWEKDDAWTVEWSEETGNAITVWAEHADHDLVEALQAALAWAKRANPDDEKEVTADSIYIPTVQRQTITDYYNGA